MIDGSCSCSGLTYREGGGQSAVEGKGDEGSACYDSHYTAGIKNIKYFWHWHKKERKLIIHAVTNNTVKLEVIVTILLDHISPEIPESFLLILLLHFLDMQGLMKKVICQGTDVIKVIIENHTKKL